MRSLRMRRRIIVCVAAGLIVAAVGCSDGITSTPAKGETPGSRASAAVASTGQTLRARFAVPTDTGVLNFAPLWASGRLTNDDGGASWQTTGDWTPDAAAKVPGHVKILLTSLAANSNSKMLKAPRRERIQYQSLGQYNGKAMSQLTVTDKGGPPDQPARVTVAFVDGTPFMAVEKEYHHAGRDWITTAEIMTFYDEKAQPTSSLRIDAPTTGRGKASIGALEITGPDGKRRLASGEHAGGAIAAMIRQTANMFLPASLEAQPPVEDCSGLKGTMNAARLTAAAASAAAARAGKKAAIPAAICTATCLLEPIGCELTEACIAAADLGTDALILAAAAVGAAWTASQAEKDYNACLARKNTCGTIAQVGGSGGDVHRPTALAIAAAGKDIELSHLSSSGRWVHKTLHIAAAH